MQVTTWQHLSQNTHDELMITEHCIQLDRLLATGKLHCPSAVMQCTCLAVAWPSLRLPMAAILMLLPPDCLLATIESSNSALPCVYYRCDRPCIESSVLMQVIQTLSSMHSYQPPLDSAPSALYLAACKYAEFTFLDSCLCHLARAIARGCCSMALIVEACFAVC